MGMDSVYKLSVLLGMTDNMTPKLPGVANNVTSSVDKMNNAFGSMQKAGAVMAGVGTAITGAAIGTVTSTFATQDALAELSSLGVTELQAVEKAAKNFSDTWAGTTKSDFITAAYDIKSGIASLSDEGVAQFTELAGLTAKATKSTTGEMTSLFATGYGIYKNYYGEMSDLEFGEMFSSGISTAVKNYKTAGSEMASAISALGATATNANVPLDEQLAILGTLQTTMSGSEAATKYKAFINGAASAGEKLGLKFTDANNQLMSMPEILTLLKGKYGDTIDAVEKQQLKEAFGTDEAIAAIDLLYGDVDGLNNGIADLSASMSKGMDATKGMAEAINNTPAQKFTVLKQQVHNSVEELGKGLLPTVNNVMEKVGAFIQKGSNWIENNQKTVQSIMKIVLIIGSLLTVLGVITTVVGTVGKTLTNTISIISKVRGKITQLNFAFLSSPITWVIIGIVALVAAFVLLWNKSEAFRNFWIGLFNNIKSVCLDAWGTIQPAIQTLGEKFKELYVAIQPILKVIGVIFGTVLTVFLAIAVGVFQGIVNALTPMINAFSSLVSFVTNVVNAIVALFKGDFSGALNFAKAAIGNLKDFFVNVFTGIKAFIGGFFSGFKSVVNSAMSAVGLKFSTIITGIKSTVSNGLNAVKGFFSGILGGAKNIVGNILGGIKDKFKSMIDGAKSIVSGGINKIKGLFNFNWSFPKLKMPHFAVQGKFSLAPPSVPKLAIEWYKDGGIMTRPTMFGMNGDKAMVGGEAGAEAIVPLSQLWTRMKDIVRGVIGEKYDDSEQKVKITSDMFKKETRTRKINTSESTFTSSSSEKNKGITIQNLKVTVDISKIKDLNLLYKLIDELKDAQNGNDPEPVME